MNAIRKLVGFCKRHPRGAANLFAWVGVVLLMWAVIKVLAFNWPMWAENYRGAVGTSFGDQAIVQYDRALQARHEQNYWRQQYGNESCVNILSRGYADMADQNGSIPASRQEMASRYQTLIGNCLYWQGKLQPAADAYAQALRHNPDNIEAKYNLEMLNLRINPPQDKTQPNPPGQTPPQTKPPGAVKGPGPGQKPDDQGKPDSGQNPGKQPGKDPGKQPGQNPGDNPGDKPGDQPGDQPGTQPGNGPPASGQAPPGDQPGPGAPGKGQPGASPGKGDQGDAPDQDAQTGDQGKDGPSDWKRPGGGAGKFNGKGI